VSSSGAAEFAKRFLIRDMRVDLSPISMKALLVFYHPFGLMALKEKSNLSYSPLMRRVGGAGFRVWSQGRKARSSKWRRFLLLYRRSLLPMDLLLLDDKPLNPYLKGQFIWYLPSG